MCTCNNPAYAESNLIVQYKCYTTIFSIVIWYEQTNPAYDVVQIHCTSADYENIL